MPPDKVVMRNDAAAELDRLTRSSSNSPLPGNISSPTTAPQLNNTNNNATNNNDTDCWTPRMTSSTEHQQQWHRLLHTDCRQPPPPTATTTPTVHHHIQQLVMRLLAPIINNNLINQTSIEALSLTTIAITATITRLASNITCTNTNNA